MATRQKVEVGTLKAGAMFVAPLTRRVGVVLGEGPAGTLVKFTDGESKELHTLVQVEVA